MKRPLFTVAIAAVLAGAAIAGCGGDDEPAKPTDSATAEAASATVTQPPTPTPVPLQSPRVLWMLADNAGAGAVRVRFETDVPTTASLKTFRAPGASSGAAPLDPQEDKQFATTHSLVIGTGGVPSGYEVTVTDASGKKATGLLESGQVVGTQYFSAGANAPKVTLQDGRKALVSWANRTIDPAAKPAIGEVLLFAKTAGCTTVQACVGTRVARSDTGQVTSDGTGESHAVQVTIPPATDRDYQFLIAAAPQDTPAGAISRFFQLNVAGKDVK